MMYKVVQIWLGQTVTCLHTNSPGHIWTTLYFERLMYLYTQFNHPPFFRLSVFMPTHTHTHTHTHTFSKTLQYTSVHFFNYSVLFTSKFNILAISVWLSNLRANFRLYELFPRKNRYSWRFFWAVVLSRIFSNEQKVVAFLSVWAHAAASLQPSLFAHLICGFDLPCVNYFQFNSYGIDMSYL